MVDEDENALWRQFIKDIKPLSNPPASNAHQKPKGKKAPVNKSPVIHEKLIIAPGLKSPPGPSGTPSRQLDRRTEDKLRKGKMTIEGTLDLHGLTQAKAQAALDRFIIEAHKAGKRCVLVITGKGLSKKAGEDWMDDQPGILKRRLPVWLENPPLNTLVLKYIPAQPIHGGSGAFYIYLRRSR